MINILQFWVQLKKWKIVYMFSTFTVINIVYSFAFPQAHIALLVYFFPFLIAIGLLSNRKKHFYEASTFVRPVKHSDIAKARVIFLSFTIIMFQLINLGFSLFYQDELKPGFVDLCLGTSISFIIVNIYCIGKDLTVGFMRRKGITANRVQNILIIIIIAFNILGLLTFKFFKDKPDEVKWIVDFINGSVDFIISNISLWMFLFPALAIVTLLYNIKVIRYRTYFLDE